MNEFIKNTIRVEFGIAACQQQAANCWDAMLSKVHNSQTATDKAAMAQAMLDAVADKLNTPSSRLLQRVT